MARSPAGLNQLLEWGWADFSPPAPPPGVRSGSVRLDALGDGFEELENRVLSPKKAPGGPRKWVFDIQRASAAETRANLGAAERIRPASEDVRGHAET